MKKTMNFIATIPLVPETLITNIEENELPEWVAETSYEIDNRVQIAALHLVFKALIVGSNQNPPDNLTGETPAWKVVGSTNPYRMFDNRSRGVSTRAENITVSHAPGKLFNAVSLLNILGLSVVVTVTDPVEGIVYSRDVDMVDNTGISDWYDWFFEPPARKTNVLLTNLPAYPNATISVTVSGPGKTVQIGEMVVGRVRNIGTTLNGLRLGLEDYTDNEPDDDGVMVIVDGPYSNTTDFPVFIESFRVENVRRLLLGYKGIPLVYFGDTEHGEAMLYGTYRELALEVKGDLESKYNLEIREFI